MPKLLYLRRVLWIENRRLKKEAEYMYQDEKIEKHKKLRNSYLYRNNRLHLRLEIWEKNSQL